MTALNEAYVIGLLTELEERTPTLEAKLQAQAKRAQAVDAELSTLLGRLDASKATLKTAKQSVAKLGLNINESNMDIARLHQEIASIKTRAEDVGTEMERVGPGAIHRKLRRERAKMRVQIEDREQEIEDLRADVVSMRETLAQSEALADQERERTRVTTAELDKLQSILPSPYLFAELFEVTAARAHCRFYLDGSAHDWSEEMESAIHWSMVLHKDLRTGKYRLDRNSELVGGRAMATAEALYGAVAIERYDMARELFGTATDAGLYFHQIFNVFRVWCLGLYLDGRTKELRELLRLHQFAEGLRGGYVNAFIGLLKKDSKRFSVGIKNITKYEWELWQDPTLVRGAGVVNLGAVALCKLALSRKLPVDMPHATVPDGLLATSVAPRAPTD